MLFKNNKCQSNFMCNMVTGRGEEREREKGYYISTAIMYLYTVNKSSVKLINISTIKISTTFLKTSFIIQYVYG